MSDRSGNVVGRVEHVCSQERADIVVGRVRAARNGLRGQLYERAVSQAIADNEFVGTKIAAHLLGISEAGVRQAVFRGRLKRHGTARRALFALEDLEAYQLVIQSDAAAAGAAGAAGAAAGGVR